MKQASRNVVIVGGGIAGLCAGVYARGCGYDVQVLEQHTVPGGLATSWTRDGYTFETCLHWLVGSRPGADMHARWREVFDIDRLAFVDAQEFVRLETEAGAWISIYADVDRLEAELMAKAPQDRDEILSLTSAVRRFTGFPMPDWQAPWPQRMLALMRLAPRLPQMRRWAGMTGAEYGRAFKSPLLRRFFTEGAAGRMSAVALLFTLAWLNGRNAGYAIGGAKAIIDAILQRFHALGGRLRLQAKVAEILTENGAAVGVRLAGGETIPADWVISAADGHATIYDLLGGRYRNDAIDARYRTMETFPSYVQVSLGVAQDLSDQPGFVSRVLDAPLQVDPQTAIDAVGLRIFHFDPTFAPPGKTAVTAFLPTYNFAYWVDAQRDDPARYAAEKRRVAEAVVAILERRLPGVRERIETTDVSTPASVIRFTGNWKGSMEGWLLTPGSGWGSMRRTLPGLGRFAMAGQWVQPGGGLPAGLMTARAAVHAICRHDRRPFLVQAAALPSSAAA